MHTFSSSTSQAVHVPLQAEKGQVIKNRSTNVCKFYIQNVVFNMYIPVAQLGPEYPAGHAVHMFSFFTSQAVHIPPQAEDIMLAFLTEI